MNRRLVFGTVTSGIALLALGCNPSLPGQSLPEKRTVVALSEEQKEALVESVVDICYDVSLDPDIATIMYEAPVYFYRQNRPDGDVYLTGRATVTAHNEGVRNASICVYGTGWTPEIHTALDTTVLTALGFEKDEDGSMYLQPAVRDRWNGTCHEYRDMPGTFPQLPATQPAWTREDAFTLRDALNNGHDEAFFGPYYRLKSDTNRILSLK